MMINTIAQFQASAVGDLPKDVNLPHSAFLNNVNVFPSGEVLNFYFIIFFNCTVWFRSSYLVVFVLCCFNSVS